MNKNFKKYKKKEIDFNSDEFKIINIADKCNIKIIDPVPQGNEILGRCPFCGDSSNANHGHLYLNVLKNKYRCVKCGESGYALSLYAKCKGIDNKEAVKELLNNNISNNVKQRIKKMESKIKEESNITIASIERRDKVYNALLDLLTLSDKHRHDLLRRGLSEGLIAKEKFKTLPLARKEREDITYKLIKMGCKIKGIPGFYRNDNGHWTFVTCKGYLIPSRDKEGRIQGFQIRKDDEEKRKYRWFSSKCYTDGRGSNAQISVVNPDGKPTVIVEGTLKNIVCGFLKPKTRFIGIPGTNAIEGLVELLEELNVKEAFLALDMDKTKNKYVLNAEKKIIKVLQENNIKITVYNWDISKGKGLDDYLLYRIIKKQKYINNNSTPYII